MKRQRSGIRDLDCVATRLHRELRGPDDRCAYSLARIPNFRSNRLKRKLVAQLVRKVGTEIAEAGGFRP